MQKKMNSMSKENAKNKDSTESTSIEAADKIVGQLTTNELFIGIVGPLGSGTGTAAEIIHKKIEERGIAAKIIKVSDIIKQQFNNGDLPDFMKVEKNSFDRTNFLQDSGDKIRAGTVFGQNEDNSAVARLVLHKITASRAFFQGKGENFEPVKPVEPDGVRRAYIIESIRHPSEVALFRKVYGSGFYLLGVVCSPNVCFQRTLIKNYKRKEHSDRKVRENVRSLLKRDENAEPRYGQHVEDTFHESDFFVDNTKEGNQGLTETGMDKSLDRFCDLITENGIIRPNVSETAMHVAYTAKLRSACLSRQVGAALVNEQGNIVSTGTNDVPKSGGGLYGEDINDTSPSCDHRCVNLGTPFCSNTNEQNKIINKLIDIFAEQIPKMNRNEISKKIRKTGIGNLIVFSRAVHAEMNAILSAATSGVSPVGCRMFVTTFPCHNCARHIVSAGIKEVQYIEPYPKSKVFELHEDSVFAEKTELIEQFKNESEENSNFTIEFKSPLKGRVKFSPFVGVSPKLYRRVFLKDREYKNKETGERKIGNPQWGSNNDIFKISYHEMEFKLSLGERNG